VGAFDGLRGAAVAAVLLHHAGHLTGGWLGVDLFFVLSGYLITALLLSGWRSSGSVGLRTFWARRARRLAPALVITVVAAGAYAWWRSTPTEMLFIRWDGFATLFEWANWRAIAIRNSYFRPTQFRSPLWHTWSLSIEEQLYLVWPLVVAGVLAWRRRPSAVLAASVAGAVASAGTMVWLAHHGASQSALYYGTHTRAAAVLLGAALASGRVVLGPQRWAATRSARHALGVVGALALGWAWVALDGADDRVYRGLLPACSLAAAAVIASVADRRRPGPVGWVAELWPLQALGRISYGVYLYHWPVYLVLDGGHVVSASGWALVALRVAVTIALAAVSYRFVEEPIRRGRALTGRSARAALPAAIAVASIALLAGTLHGTPPPTFDADAAVDRAAAPGAPVVLLAGDSVPLVLGLQMTEDRDALGISVANRGLPGCHLLAALGPIRGVEGNVRTDVSDCSAAGRYRASVRKTHPDVAVVLFGEFPNEAVRIGGRWLMPCQPDYLAALRRRLDHLIDDLRVDDTPVVLLTAPGSNVSWIVDRVKPGMAGRVACTNRVLEQIAAARQRVTLVDLAGFVCPPGRRCKEKVGGIDLRPDGLHFEGAGAAYIARWLVPRVLAAAQEEI
jgi:peptidoglycan/LPS O-acetylase OafA/YrhL/lysophospholipase L1-like esterase